MLVLSRKAGQRVCIGDEIEVTVLDIRGSRVRLGVNAPRNIPIDRDEWHAQIEVDLNEHGVLELAKPAE
jgi:carbon storage regulator